MFSTKPSFFVIALLLLFVSSSSFANGSSQINHGLGLGEGENEVVLWGTRRSVAEENYTEDSSLVLAAERTHRKDPSDHFKYYKGGWNISEEHYIYSVAFTATPLFLIAAIWFVCFGLSLLVLCSCYCCCRRRPYGYSRTAYAVSLILLALFTIAAIVGSVVLYTGQGKFHNTTSDTLVYVVGQANKTVDNLRNVSSYLGAAKNINVDQIGLPQDIRSSIDDVDIKISAAATTLQIETKKNSNNIRDALETVRLALIVIAAVMLVVAFLGFLLSILGLQFLVYLLVIIGWILITITFILGGVFLALHNVVGDTCVAMDEWVQNPTAHTALDDILPCVDNATAQVTLSQSKDVTFQLAKIVNGIIVNVSNQNIPSRVGPPLYFNQSGPLVPVLCNPFNPDRTNRTCAPGEVDFQNATQVWRGYVCEVSDRDICTTVGRLTPKMFDQMNTAVNVSYGLYSYGPWLTDLLDCTFVRDTFTGIHNEYCSGLRLYSNWIYIGLAMVSVAVMLSLIFWVIYARERRHRKYSKLDKAAASAQNSYEQKP